MLIIGCDFHSGFQQIAIFDNQTGEIQEKKLLHPDEATRYYRCQPEPVRVGMESQLRHRVQLQIQTPTNSRELARPYPCSLLLGL
jgi:hypothetical protein